MFTQCPQCEAVFQVSDQQIEAANGEVRCGQCLTIFSALQHEREDLLKKNASLTTDTELTNAIEAADTETLYWANHEPLFTTAPASKDNATRPGEIPVAGDVNTSEASGGFSAFDAAIEEDRADTISADKATDTRTDSPETQQQQAPEIPALLLEELHAEQMARLRPSRLPWLLGCLILIVLLAAQVIYLKRDQLARNPELRPWLSQACELIQCSLAPPYDIRQIELLGLDVHSHPETARALVASTALINNAPIPQPYPLLTLTFSDMTGTRVAQRRFLPEEYLPKDINLNQGMTPRLPVKITLELSDPGENAINFEFHVSSDPRRQPREATLKNPLAHLLSNL